MYYIGILETIELDTWYHITMWKQMIIDKINFIKNTTEDWKYRYDSNQALTN